MMEISGKKKLKPDPFTDTVFSWSLENIFDEDLFKDKVFVPLCDSINLILLYLLRKVVALYDYDVLLLSSWIIFFFKRC